MSKKPTLLSWTFVTCHRVCFYEDAITFLMVEVHCGNNFVPPGSLLFSPLPSSVFRHKIRRIVCWCWVLLKVTAHVCACQNRRYTQLSRSSCVDRRPLNWIKIISLHTLSANIKSLKNRCNVVLRWKFWFTPWELRVVRLNICPS